MLFKPFINLWSQNVEDILFSVALKFILKFIFFHNVDCTAVEMSDHPGDLLESGMIFEVLVISCSFHQKSSLEFNVAQWHCALKNIPCGRHIPAQPPPPPRPQASTWGWPPPPGCGRHIWTTPKKNLVVIGYCTWTRDYFYQPPTWWNFSSR